MQRRFASWLGLVSLSLCLGCDNSTAIHGTVTLNGQPVQRGSIAFHPAGGTGRTYGAMIENGEYLIDEAAPGLMVATVTAVDVEQVAKTRDDFLKPGSKGTSVDLIPPGAEGNNREVEVVEGNQSIDIDINTN